MSDVVSDILEEQERGEIRGTLVALSRRYTMETSARSVDVIDPYTREARLWVRPGMSVDQVKQAVRRRLGLDEETEDAKSVTFAISFGSQYKFLVVKVDPFSIEFKS